MNRIHRTLFNRRLGVVQAVGENARRQGKSGRSSGTLVGAVVLLASFGALAADLPSGGVIAAGSGSIASSGSAMRVQQNSDKLIVNWQSFDIGKEASVTFAQPSSSSVALNRVLGSDGSSILGRLDANGRVFLVNPNGILFGKDASVNVGGLVASTLNIADGDFLAGVYRFRGEGGSVLNRGALSAADGGAIALLGGKVSNEGIINARLGSVVLAAGKTITLDFAGDGLLKVEIDEGLKNALVDNHQLIVADGGEVLLTAKGAEALLETLVNNTGVIQARTLGERGGKIVLLGDFDGGTVQVAGTLDASAPDGGDGGFVETSGAHVKIADGTVVTTKATAGKSGTWLVDPATFTIGADGDVSGATVQAALANNGEFIASASAGDVNVDDAITWSSGTLKLYASHDVNVSNVLTATGGASFEASYGRLLDGSGLPTATLTDGTGKDADGVPYGLYMAKDEFDGFVGRLDFSGSGSVTLNDVSHTVINDAAGFIGMSENGAYVLGSDLSISDQTLANFNGSLNALGHTVLFTNNANTSGQVGGLFGTLGSNAMVSNLGLPSGGGAYNGSAASVGLLANVNAGSIVNAFSGSSISNVEADSIGGLVGTNSGLIARSHTLNASVTATKVAGGLVGTNTSAGRIVDSSARAVGSSSAGIDASALTTTYVGGLIGVNDGEIRRSWASNYVRAGDTSPGGSRYDADIPGFIGGGFVGLNTGTIAESYAYRNTSATSVGGVGTSGATAQYMGRMGGFVGENSGSIENAYAYDTLYGNSGSGDSSTHNPGAAGFAWKNSGVISNSYAYHSTFYGAGQRYGFVYDNTGGTLINTYWSATSGGATAVSVIDLGIADGESTTYLSAAQAANLANYSGFDTDIWSGAVSGFPMLKTLDTMLYVGNNMDTTLKYGVRPLATSSGTLWVVGLQAGDTRTSVFANTTSASNQINSIDASYLNGNGYLNAGTYDADDVLILKSAASSVYSGKEGSFTVSPKQLTLSGTGVINDKVYDGTADATFSTTGASTGGLTGWVGTERLNFTATVSFNSADTTLDASLGDITASGYKAATLVFTSVSDGANGGLAGNYILPTVVVNNQTVAGGLGAAYTTYAKITPRPLDAAVLSAGIADKTYDGNGSTTATPTTSDAVALADIAAGNLGLGYDTAIFDDINAGTDKLANLSGLALSGSGAHNYILSTTDLTDTADIAPRVVGVYGSRSGSGTTQVDSGELYLSNVLAGDTVNLSGSLTLSNTDAGSQALSLNGLSLDNANYTLVGAVGAFIIGDFVRTVVSASSGVSFDDANNPSVVTTTGDKSIINWQNFSVGAGETVQFVQPNSYSIVLNRVVGNAESIIAGTLSSNGRVFVLNPNGVLFAAGSNVNVSALLSSTLALGDDDFNNGRYVFTASGGSGSVVSEGDIVIVDGGFLALASGGGVTASGDETVRGGKVILASANSLTLDLNASDNGLAGYAISSLSGTTTVSGDVDVSASSGDGGLIETAGNALAVNTASLSTGTNGTWSLTQPSITVGGEGATHSAIFVQDQLAVRNLLLNAQSGDLAVNENISWSADTTLGLASNSNNLIKARIAASGADAGVAIKGTYVIDSARLDYAGNPIGHEGAGFTLSGANAAFSVDGNAYTLLHALPDFAMLDGTGLYALAQDIDATGTTYASALLPTLSGTLAGLGNVIDHLTIDAGLGDYVGLIGQATAGSVIRDVGLSNANVKGHGYVGVLLGSGVNTSIDMAWASGVLTGTANDTDTSGDLGGSRDIGGLVGSLESSTLTNSHANVGVTGAASLAGGFSLWTGGLIGDAVTSVIDNVYATGAVTGNNYTGGLLGRMQGGSLDNAWASGDVTGVLDTSGLSLSPDYVNYASWVGGLVGLVEGLSGSLADTPVAISHVRAEGAVLGGAYVGGLLGSIASETVSITDAHALGDVALIPANGSVIHTHSHHIGGLVGFSNGSISDSSASGDVTAVDERSDSLDYVGGLVGESRGSIDGSSASGAVFTRHNSVQGVMVGGQYVGGLVGYNSGSIGNSWASGNVDGSTAVGGLAGVNTGSIDGSSASGSVIGWGSLGGLTGANGGSITNSEARGDVVSDSSRSNTGQDRGDNVGGLSGTNTGSIDGSSASGNVEGGQNSGALVGVNTGAVTNSIASGGLDSGSSESGGLIGQNTGTVDAASAWNNPAPPPAQPETEQPNSLAQLAQQTPAASGAMQGAEQSALPESGSGLEGASLTGNSFSLLGLLSARNDIGADELNFSANVEGIEVDGQYFDLGSSPASRQGGAGCEEGVDCPKGRAQ